MHAGNKNLDLPKRKNNKNKEINMTRAYQCNAALNVVERAIGRHTPCRCLLIVVVPLMEVKETPFKEAFFSIGI